MNKRTYKLFGRITPVQGASLPVYTLHPALSGERCHPRAYVNSYAQVWFTLPS